MRTKAPILFVMAVLVVGMAWQMAGVASMLAGSGPGSGIPASQLNDTAGEYNVNDGGLDGSASGGSGSDIIGLVIGGVQDLADIIGLAVMLPFILVELGIPYYWAYPLGLIGQLIAFIGLAELATNRDWS